MKTKFNKLSISILSILAVLGIALLVISSIKKTDNIVLPAIGFIAFFLFGIYFIYLKNKRYVNKDSIIFPLSNRKIFSTFNIVFFLFLLGLVLILMVFANSNFGLAIGLGVVLFNLLSLVLFPYSNGYLIMVDSNGIYSPRSEYLQWQQIKTYSIETDLMLIAIELKDNKKEAIGYNKYVDIELLKKELQRRIK